MSYGAAKSGLNHLTRSLAQEWGPKIRVNCIALGPTITENFRSFVLPKDDPTGSKYFAAVPMRRGGEPEEVGRVCVFLARDRRFRQRHHDRSRRRDAAGVLYDAGLKTITDCCKRTEETMTTRKPELSLYLTTYTDGPQHDWRATLDLARAMDAAGVDRLVVSDHLVFGENLDAYSDPSIGGQAGGRQPTGPDGAWLEPLTVLTAIAATTTRIRLGTAILLAALRRPAVLAKRLATLDVLSDGRVDLGVGVGWQREEYDAAGLSFEGRGRLLDHTLEVCQTLWTQQRASYESAELTFDGFTRCPSQCNPVVCRSGSAAPSTTRWRAGSHASDSGWIPWGSAYADIPGAIAAMKDKVLEFGGDPTDLQVQGVARVVKDDDGSIDYAASAAGVPALVAAGVTDVRFPASLTADPDQAVEILSSLVAGVPRRDALTRLAECEPTAKFPVKIRNGFTPGCVTVYRISLMSFFNASASVPNTA